MVALVVDLALCNYLKIKQLIHLSVKVTCFKLPAFNPMIH